MLTNGDCTLYRYNKKTEGYDRYFIPSVYWRENKSGSVNKGGLSGSHDTIVYIYNGSVLPETPTKDILVKGNCPFEFCNTSHKSISDDFIELRKRYKYVTVMSIDDCNFGSLKHYEITAK